MSEDDYLEVREAIGGVEGACFGNYDENSEDCASCGIRSRCELKTSEIYSGQDSVGESSVAFDVDPVDYLIDVLKGKYVMSVGSRGKFKNHYFRDGKKPKVMISISRETGNIMIRTESSKVELGSLGSIAQVEEILTVLEV